MDQKSSPSSHESNQTEKSNTNLSSKPKPLSDSPWVGLNPNSPQNSASAPTSTTPGKAVRRLRREKSLFKAESDIFFKVAIILGTLRNETLQGGSFAIEADAHIEIFDFIESCYPPPANTPHSDTKFRSNLKPEYYLKNNQKLGPKSVAPQFIDSFWIGRPR
jgi:hypothetical protein